MLLCTKFWGVLSINRLPKYMTYNPVGTLMLEINTIHPSIHNLVSDT